MYQEILTVKELAEYLRVGHNVAYRLVHSKGFPTLKLGRKILIPVEELKKWISQNTNTIY